MLSDDTEHTLMVLEALTEANDDVNRFRTVLARKFRWWFAALPAGIGMATARSIIKLWVGISPKRSGVFSAGNGPAMRSALIGAYFSSDLDKMEAYVAASTEMTHTDPKALVGALAVAFCAANAAKPESCWQYLEGLAKYEVEEWPALLSLVREGVDGEWSIARFTESLGLQVGVTGYVYHTVPFVLFIWFRGHSRGDGFERMLTDVLNCGGDSDTTGAIIGALAGVQFGRSGIPDYWVDPIYDWPRGKSFIENHIQCLQGGTVARSPFFLLQLARNLIFLIIVLLHGLLRLIPCRMRRRFFTH
jgi:ADP-ribosylglycohydrolase